MSAVTKHLEQRGSAFEEIPHRQAVTCMEEARALGVEAGDVLKTLAIKTASGYALMVVPASYRLDMRLVREALDDSHARLATEDELQRDFAGYELGALPPLGTLLGAKVYVDPEVLRHDVVAFAAGSQTESVRIRTEDLFAREQVINTPLIRQQERGEDPMHGLLR
jgi:Ala-tRNA(Pro) deacylase